MWYRHIHSQTYLRTLFRYFEGYYAIEYKKKRYKEVKKSDNYLMKGVQLVLLVLFSILSST